MRPPSRLRGCACGHSRINGPTGSYSAPEFPYEKPVGWFPLWSKWEVKLKFPANKQRRLRSGLTSFLSADLKCIPRSTICVQVVYKKAGLKGLKMDLSNAESTTDS